MKINELEIIKLMLLMVKNAERPSEEQYFIFRSDADDFEEPKDVIHEYSEALVFAQLSSQSIILEGETFTTFTFEPTIWKRETNLVHVIHFAKEEATFSFRDDMSLSESITFAKGVADKINKLLEKQNVDRKDETNGNNT